MPEVHSRSLSTPDSDFRSGQPQGLYRLTVMTRPLRVLSGSRPFSRGLGDAGLRHFFRDAGEYRFVRFVHRFPYASHVYLLIVQGSSSYSSPKHYDRSAEDACLLHYAHMIVQS